MSETELEVQPKRRGRPKTINVDKKEYQKQYREKNREVLSEKKKEYYSENKERILENQKEYIENLKIDDPEKFKDLRIKQKEEGNFRVKRSLQLLNLISELYKKGLLSVPDSHKELIKELII